MQGAKMSNCSMQELIIACGKIKMCFSKYCNQYLEKHIYFIYKILRYLN